MKYTVEAAINQDALELRGSDIDSRHETLKEAKERAKYYVTQRYADASEGAPKLGYARVMNESGECVFDVFGK